MAWPNPFRRHDENTRTYWGYTFQLTPEHLTPEQAHPLKYSYDVLGEECLNILNELLPYEATPSVPQPSGVPTLESGDSNAKTLPPGSESSKPIYKRPKRDLYTVLEANHASHPKLDQLWTELHTIPDWVSWPQIARGQDVFYRYGGANLTGLAYQSLLGGMGANRVVEVLARTGGFNVKVARHRLFETTQHILECTRSLESIQPGGAGFASSIRVRLLHASVRQRIMKLAASRPDYYSIEQYGIPINDLDCIATIGTFSATLLWLSLPRQGIFPSEQETLDYIALWRLIAYYTGTPTDFFETPTKAKAVMESLLMNEINPSPTSAILANNIIRCLENTPPAYASRSFLEVSARWLNGNELADALKLGRPAPHYWLLIGGQCLFFCSICYIYRVLAVIDWILHTPEEKTWDRKKIELSKKVFWDVIVEGKYGLQGEKTVFEFKYVPELGRVGTEQGEEVEKRGERRDVEWRSAKTLVAVVLGFGVTGWVGIRVMRVMIGWVS